MLPLIKRKRTRKSDRMWHSQQRRKRFEEISFIFVRRRREVQTATFTIPPMLPRDSARRAEGRWKLPNERASGGGSNTSSEAGATKREEKWSINKILTSARRHARSHGNRSTAFSVWQSIQIPKKKRGKASHIFFLWNRPVIESQVQHEFVEASQTAFNSNTVLNEYSARNSWFSPIYIFAIRVASHIQCNKYAASCEANKTYSPNVHKKSLCGCTHAQSSVISERCAWFAPR